MIQRIQSVYLFFAAILCILFLFVPVAKAGDITVTPNDNTVSAALSIASAMLALVAIFVYKNRRLQLRISFITIALLFIATANTWFTLTKSEITHTMSAFIGIPFIAILLLFLAIRSIRKDEALVKSMDRFR